MAAVAKVLFGPDLHYGYDNYQTAGADGVPSRVAEWRSCADALVRIARENQVDVALMPGDGFTSGKHSAQAIIEVYNLYRRLRETGAAVVGTLGNHDWVGAGRRGPVDVLAELGESNWGITIPDVVEVPQRDPDKPKIQVAVLPWAKAGLMLQDTDSAGDLNARASAALSALVLGFAAQVDPDRPSVLLGHWPVSGCMMSSGQTLVGGEPAVTLGDLQAGPWAGVIMGHIHKRQEFPGRPLVVHTGAMTRRDFGEEHDDCGCYILDTDTGEATWHELPARRFYTWTLSEAQVQTLAAGETFPIPFEVGRAEDAICRVRYRATEEQHSRIDRAALEQALYHAGAHFVAGVFPEIERQERARVQGLTEETDPLSALEAWLQLRSGLSLELRTEVQTAMRNLLAEVS